MVSEIIFSRKQRLLQDYSSHSDGILSYHLQKTSETYENVEAAQSWSDGKAN